MKEISDTVVADFHITQKLIYLGKDNILCREHTPHHSAFLLPSQKDIENNLTRPQ